MLSSAAVRAGYALGLLFSTHAAIAGRPLATDDAAIAAYGTCFLESWLERDRVDRTLVLAPACGIAHGFELGVEFDDRHPKDDVRAEGGLALKWLPQAWSTKTGFGDLNFGLKATAGYVRPADDRWRRSDVGLLGLTSLQIGDRWTVHADLGIARDHDSQTSAGLFNAALVWTPVAPMLLFAEVQTNSRQSIFGSSIRTVGGRWWLAKDTFGLDLAVGRTGGSGNGTTVTVGFGWYGN